MKVLAAIFSLFVLHTVQSANILGIFPTPSISHQFVYRALIKDLAARGHKLLIMTPDPFETDNPNVTQIDWHSSYETFQTGFDFVKFKENNLDSTDLLNFFFPTIMKCFEIQINHPEVKQLIKDRHKYKFDVIVMELIMNYPMLAFAEIFDVPVIEFDSLDTVSYNHIWMGNEANPVVHPELMFPFQNKRLTFNERWQVLRYLWKTWRITPYKDQEMVKFIKKHFPIAEPDLTKLRNRVELMMTNTHPALGYLRPILPNTIQLGFMHIEPPKPLQDGPLKEFLDSSKHGVIYLSFGSNVKSKDLSPEIKQMFLDVFGSLKYNVLWKFEDNSLKNLPKNVMIQKWLPQADLLAHPKIKLFITHGGQQSMEETIDRAVPTIVVPFMGDQDANALRMEQKEIGKILNIHTLSTEKIRSAINEMLKPQYKENIKNLRNIIYDQPMSSREKAVWWTEYVIRHKGAKHFKYIGKDIPFYEKYFLDFAAIGVLGLLIFIKVCLFVSSKLFSRKVVNKNKKD